MVDNVKFEISGTEALSLKLETIGRDMKFKGGRFALRKAANLVRNAAKQNAVALNDPATANDISKNIAVRWSSSFFKRTQSLKFRVGILGGARVAARSAGGDKRNPGGDTFHWRFLEFGTSRSKAKPFFRRALSDNVANATGEFVTQYDKALVRAIRKAEQQKPSPR